MERSGLLADTLLILPGFAQTALTRGENGENKSLWPPALEIADVIDGMKGPFLRLFFTRKDVGFSDAAAQLLQKYASPLARLADGSPRAPLEKRVARGLLGKDFPWEALKNVYDTAAEKVKSIYEGVAENPNVQKKMAEISDAASR